MNYVHSGSLGDVIYSLPSIKSLQGLHGKAFGKANIYLRPDVPDYIPAWAGKRGSVRMTRQDAERLIPLLQGQPGIGEVGLLTEGVTVDYNLDAFRSIGVSLSSGDIAQYYRYAFKCSPCLYVPWLTVEPSPDFAGKVLVNRTLRYRNPSISYSFLAGRPGVVFVGLADERADFAKSCPRLPFAEAKDFRQLAGWIAGAKAFIGNQSFCFSLAEALKVPRLLEIFPLVPNVIVHGPKGWAAVGQKLFQEIAEDLTK